MSLSESDLYEMSEMLGVDFIGVKEHYSNSEHIPCTYCPKNYEIWNGDKVAILRLGWTSLKDCVCSLPVSLRDVTEDGIFTTVFSTKMLDEGIRDSVDLYQFCYITVDNVVQGISTPFQISIKSRITLHSNNITGLPTNFNRLLEYKDAKIAKLEKENAILKETLKRKEQAAAAAPPRRSFRNFAEVSGAMQALSLYQENQQKEIDSLKEELKKSMVVMENLTKGKLIAEKKVNLLANRDKNGAPINLPDFKIDDLQAVPPFPFDLRT